MGILSKYTKAELRKLDKKTFMKEASYDEIFTDFGFNLNVMVMCRESTAHEDQRQALSDQVERMKYIVEKYQHFHLIEDGIVIEDAKSGLAADIRPKFQEAIKRAVSSEVDIILVQEASRFQEM